MPIQSEARPRWPARLAALSRVLLVLPAALLDHGTAAAATPVLQCRQAGVTEYSDRPGRCDAPRVLPSQAEHNAPASSATRAVSHEPAAHPRAIGKNTHATTEPRRTRSAPAAGGATAQRCRSLAHQIEQIDTQAARPSTAQRQDRLRAARQRVRDQQGALRC